MGITPGTRIGTYEVTSPLGEGGMGVVYRARDTKLLREVALKVLPDHFAADPDRLSRFQREAQVLASLNHPNIAQIYGLESGCIVMELVEGETLAERIQRAPIPIEETISIASQVADALEAAHERAIMHRDLKPANIKLTAGGQVKVLDFGLAKVLGTVEPGGDPANSPTLLSGSIPGMIMGTAAYMSPEQARGKSVDARTDIWAFGCILYEMLTGRRLFEGEMATDSLAKVIAGQPDWEALPADTPPAMRMLLTEALKKDPRQRLQHIHDARLFLNPALIPSAPKPITPAAPSPKRRIPWLTAALVVALLAALYPATLYFTRTAPDQPVMRFEVPAPGIIGGQEVPVISPDGQRIVYAGITGGKQQIWVHPIGSLNAQPLAGTENGGGMFWSPDSRHVGFFSDGKLKKVDVTGGGVQTLCDASIPAPGAWSRSGIILFTGVSQGPPALMRVSEAGGQVTPVTGPKQNELQALPQFLPDDRHFIFHSFPAAGAQDVSLDLGSLDSQATRRLTTLGNISPAANSPAIFASPGFILYSRDRTLLAQAFDVAHMSLSGEPSPIAENVRFEFSVSNTGILVYRTAPDSQQPQQSTAQLSWFDRKRKAIGQIPSPAVVGSVRLSQDDQRIAIDSTGPGTPSDIWVIDSRGVPNKITADNPLFDAYPVWSPDASRIVFAAAREKDVTLQLYQRASNGIGIPLRLLPENIAEITMPTDWSLDGQSILFARYAIASLLKINLWVLPTSGDAKPRVLVQNGFANVQAQFSPDSRYIAYTTNEQGSYQIVVQTFPDPSLGKWTITRDGGTEPIWKHDGRELYYLAPDGKIMAVPIKSGATFEAQQPAPLFQSSLRQQQPPFQRRYAVSSDGQRFLMATNASQSGATGNDIPITAVLNWTSILKKK